MKIDQSRAWQGSNFNNVRAKSESKLVFESLSKMFRIFNTKMWIKLGMQRKSNRGIIWGQVEQIGNEKVWSDEGKYWIEGSTDKWISLRKISFDHIELYLTEFSSSLQIWKG